MTDNQTPSVTNSEVADIISKVDMGALDIQQGSLPDLGFSGPEGGKTSGTLSDLLGTLGGSVEEVAGQLAEGINAKLAEKY
jgi:hypothetical protein